MHHRYPTLVEHLGLSFDASLQSSLAGGAAVANAPTFTRADGADGRATFIDFEGRVVPVRAGEARFMGARRVANLLPAASADLTTGWTKSNTSVTTGVTDPDGGTRAVTVTANAGNADWYIGFTTTAGTVVDTMYIKRRTGSGTVQMIGADASYTSLTVTSSWQRFSVSKTGAATSYIGLRLVTSGDAVDVAFVQPENVTGQSNQNPSEYVSVGVLSAPYHGAGVDGVKYFSTLNGNTVSSNVVTEATGARIVSGQSGVAATAPVDANGPFGYLSEGSRQNRCLYSQDFSNAVWVSGGGGIAVSTNSTTAPDGTTTADTLTASGANGTLIQDLGVVASAAKAGGLWLKRKTGTGNIDLTLDGGATWTTKSVTATWTRFEITQTLANEDFGIRIVTSGDEVYAWQGQVETAAFLSSDIPVPAGSAITRAADSLTYSPSGNIAIGVGTIAADYVPAYTGNAPANSAFLLDTTAPNEIALYFPNGTQSLGMYAGGSATKATTITAGTLLRCAGIYDGSQTIACVNGAAGSAGTGSTVASTPAAMAVGSNATNAYAWGTIRNVRAYGRQLSAAVLASLTA